MFKRSIRWGILGTARITRRVAPAIQQSASGTLKAIASRSSEKAFDWAQKYNCPLQFSNYQELIDSKEIDAVYIPLPPHLHCEWTLKAAAAGKHVLCEKPMAMSAQEGELMLSACRAAGVSFWEGVMWYHHPRSAQIQEILQSGRLGKLARITAAFSHRWQSTVPPEEEYRLQRAQGGGSLMDLGWYCAGAALWAFDEVPNSVWGTAQVVEGVDAAFQAVLKFPSGRVASFDCSRQLAARRWMEIAGEDGTIVCDDFTRPWNEEKTRFWVHNSQGEAEVFVSPAANQETCMIENISQAILAGKQELKAGERALQTQQVVDVLFRSAVQGAQVQVPT